MAVHNQQLINAAVAGFTAGAMQGRSITDSTAADYATLQAAATAFANAVDQAIPADASIITPVDKYTLAHVNLCAGICQGVISGRWPTDSTQADYNTLAAAVAAVYSELAADLG